MKFSVVLTLIAVKIWEWKSKTSNSEAGSNGVQTKLIKEMDMWKKERGKKRRGSPIKKCKRIKIKYKNMNLTWLFYILFLYKQKPAIAYKSILLNWSHIYMPCTSLSETRMVCALVVEFRSLVLVVLDHVGVVWLIFCTNFWF